MAAKEYIPPKERIEEILSQLDSALDQVNEEEHAILSSIYAANTAQLKAINAASKSKSFCIEGPPGTGKSQTIVNIVASQLAQNKRIAVVCHKKAALQAIYQKFSEKDLAYLISFCYNTKDKKALVDSMKADFEKLTNENYRAKHISEKLEQTKQKIEQALKQLEQFNGLMLQKASNSKLAFYKLLQESLSLSDYSFLYNPKLDKSFNYDYWLPYGQTIEAYYNLLAQDEKASYLLSAFQKQVFEKLLPPDTFKTTLQQALSLLCKLKKLDAHNYTVSSTASSFTFYESLKELDYHSSFYHLFNSSANTVFEENYKKQERLNMEIKSLELNNAFWEKRPSIHELEHIKQVFKLLMQKSKSLSFFRFVFSLDLNKKLSFIFSPHKLEKLLEATTQFYEIKQELKDFETDLAKQYNDADLSKMQQEFTQFKQTLSANQFAWYQNAWKNEAHFEQAKQVHQVYLKLSELKAIFAFPEKGSFEIVAKKLELLKDSYTTYTSLFPIIKALHETPRDFQQYIFNEKNATKIKKDLLSVTLNPLWEKLRGSVSTSHLNAISQELFTALNLHQELQAIHLKAKHHKGFTQKYSFSLQAQNKKTADSAALDNLKKERQFLMNEFTKKTRFKELEEIIKHGGNLLAELRPIWLLQASSYKALFQENPSYFDTLIFDESSQLPFKEALPIIKNAKQIIIVGDSQQLPPATFFTKQAELAENSYSLLDAFKNKLPSIFLKWHYRSVNEELIAFNNATFYNNKLFTVPQAAFQNKEREALTIKYENQALQSYNKILEQALSYHFVENAVYKEGRNAKEANYVAQIVKQLFLSNKAKSIGVIAFSIEQKEEIQQAINQLDFFDKNLDALLEIKQYRYKNYEDFIVRNLENVQGDEKDIIIVSTAYALDEHGKLNLNFGPINKEDGYKRLNVLFSRARKHLVIVSSLKHEAIQANNKNVEIFKNYLAYAQHTSEGNYDEAKNCLKSGAPEEVKHTINPLTAQIKTALEEKGYSLDIQVGLSNFICHLALKNKEKSAYQLGIIIDDERHYSEGALIDNYVQKPVRLNEKSWTIMCVFTLDWINNKEQVIQDIEQAFSQAPSTYFKEDKAKEKLIDAFESKEKVLLFTRLLKQEKQSYFWEIALDGKDLIIHHGKIDTKGTRLVKPCKDVADGIQQKRKLIQQKINQGYQRI